MPKKNLTVFQKLTQTFGYQGKTRQQPTTFQYSKNELLKTDSKEDYEIAKLQGQQKQYISDKWTKLDQSLYNQSVYYEPNRLSAYYDYESMEFCLHGDTQIVTPDGKISIKELSDKGRDNEFIVYSYDHNIKKVVPAIARNAHHTRDEMTYKIIFDDDSYIIATYDHQFMKRDGTFERVKNLLPGDSMMPFYRKSFYNNQNYNWVYTCNSNEGNNGWVAEHTLLSELFNKKLRKKYVNKYNRIPWDLLLKKSSENITMSKTAKSLNVSTMKLKRMINDAGYNTWNTFLITYNIKPSPFSRDKKVINHKIKLIEPFGVVPVYDLTVPGFKNFATDTIFSHNTPEISAALDIYSEESCQLSEKGDMLTIYSDSKRIKSILTDLFETTLDINTNLMMWARGVCKYGDDFVYLKIDPQAGIVGCQQLPNIEIERIEGASAIKTTMASNNRIDGSTPTRELRFSWKNKDLEFQSWEIAHFRILGDDRKLPYGCSMLDKVRRIWKQLMLAEDAMLIYRTSRAPERRVFKIFVGNMDDKDIEPYVQRIANKFKRDQVVDPKNGNVDMRYNQMPVWKNTPIPLLDGRTITIEELSKEHKEGKENWVYSIQDKTLQVVPGKVVWCDKNYTAEKMIKIWLDDNTWIMTAPEHPMMLRDGSYKRADKLISGESLMPFYTKKSSTKDGMKIIDYDMVYDPKTGKYLFVHRIVGNHLLSEDRENTRNKTNFTINNNLTIHHVDFNKNNNYPNNLKWVGNVDHIDFHKSIGKERLIKYNKSEKKLQQNIKLAKEQSWHKRFEQYNQSELHKEHDLIRKNAQLLDWSKPEKKKERSEKMKVRFDDYIFSKINENILNKNIINRKTMLEFLSVDLIDYIISINKNKRLTKLRKIDRTVLEREISGRGFNTITEYINNNKLNHKVSRIEEIYEHGDVYCMTVVGQNGEDDRHNFAVKSFNLDGSVSVSGSFTRNSVDQDYFIPVRDPNQSSPIDTLPGAQNLGEIADIEYIQKKLLAALRIPKAFLGFEEAVGDGKNLALMDIRFARTINKIQKSLIQELNKIALIHLYLLGFEDELHNFTLSLSNPSAQSDLLKIEQWKEKILLYKDATTDQSQIGILPVSHTWAKRNVLGMSDNEIILDLQQQRLERAIGTELMGTGVIIKRSGIFDDVDKKYGIPEEEREKLQTTTPQEGADMGVGMGADMGAGMGAMPPAGGEVAAPLAESVKKRKIISMLGNEDGSFEDLFNMEKAQKNIKEIEEKINNILNN